MTPFMGVLYCSLQGPPLITQVCREPAEGVKFYTMSVFGSLGHLLSLFGHPGPQSPLAIHSWFTLGLKWPRPTLETFHLLPAK